MLRQYFPLPGADRRDDCQESLLQLRCLLQFPQKVFGRRAPKAPLSHPLALKKRVQLLWVLDYHVFTLFVLLQAPLYPANPFLVCKLLKGCNDLLYLACVLLKFPEDRSWHGQGLAQVNSRTSGVHATNRSSAHSDHNIAGGNEKKNIEIAKETLRLISLPETMMQFVADRPGHDFRYSLSCDKIDRLGWKPQVGFEEGLQKTIDWYKANRWWWRPLVK